MTTTKSRSSKRRTRLTCTGFGHEAFYKNVLAALRGEARPDTDRRGGRKSVNMILGVCVSAKAHL
jgi:hypothetical protein